MSAHLARAIREFRRIRAACVLEAALSAGPRRALAEQLAMAYSMRLAELMAHAGGAQWKD